MQSDMIRSYAEQPRELDIKMSQPVSDKQVQQTLKLIKEVIEPKIDKLLKQANELFKKNGVHVGASIEWYVDKYEGKNK